MKEKKEIEAPIMTEEEREERIRQEYKYQQDLLELVRTFMLMGYSWSDIFEAVKSLHYAVAKEQIDFYCGYGYSIGKMSDKHVRLMRRVFKGKE